MIYNEQDTIFVQIPSYRDEQLQHTLQDLFAKAKKPENIFVGICHQYDMKKGEDSHLFKIPFPRQNQLRIDEIDYRDSLGCCYARSKLQNLWRGEKWSLSIDAHMRFIQDWDEKCVNLLKEIQQIDKMAILSSYMPGYKIEDGKESYEDFISTSMVIFEECNLPVFNGKVAAENKNKFFQTPFIAAGFIFCNATIINEIKYDPNIYFMGEEVSLATRLWTHGYNFYAPNFTVIYHLFQLYTNDIRNHLFTLNFDKKKDLISRKRVKNILKIKRSNDVEINKDIEKYNLGNVRSLRDYERFSGIDFRRLKQRQHTKESAFYQRQPTINKEKILELNLSVKNTKHYLTQILNILPNISSISEIQCGNEFDIENCQALQNKNLQYFGIDIRDEIIHENRQYFRLEKNKIFITLDATNEALPKTDLTISVNFSNKLPLANIWSLLENIRDSESEYFLFDHDLEEKNVNLDLLIDENSKIKMRPINLCKAPFFFPNPLFLLKTNQENKLISCYKIRDISYFMDFCEEEVAKLRLQLFEILKTDFNFLERIFFEYFRENNSFQKMMLSFLTLDAKGHNKEFYYEEKFKKILDQNQNLEIRNHIFRLNYKCELKALQQKYDFISEDNFLWAQILTKDFIRFYFNQPLFID